MNKKLQNDVDFYDPFDLFGVEECEGFGTAPKYEGSGSVKFIQNFEKFKSYYVQVRGAKKRDYDNYAKKLKANGFQLYDSSQAHKCLFSTYTDGYNIINLSYMKYKTPVEVDGAKIGNIVSYINIAIESTDFSALPPINVQGDTITTPQITMFNSQPAFLVRMRDGRFIFIDGGIEDIYGRSHSDLFYNEILKQNVCDGKPTIAAWIITHPHADHMAGVIATLKKYRGQFNIEYILCNYQGERTISKELGGTMEVEGPFNYRWQMNFYNEVVSKYPEIKLITVHAGQKFHFLGLTLEILWTPENLFLPFEVGNDASVIYSLKGEEGRFIVTGDAQQINTKLLKAIYEDDLKADLLQFAHHGYRARNVDCYATIHAKYGIWTNSYETVLEMKERMVNKPEYNGVDPNADTKIIIPTSKEAVLTFYPNMSESELEPYVRNQELLDISAQLATANYD